ncbi:DeoR/GlpR family DNA-binding transcription regulator [Deminuibacter soli]|uniref:DeoR/GlpR transcriptional regulator n=1 Tax=Deminuibacter soli TaxID=2291815 RepID=A0A3E1NDC5_9BACT|nr:DeoR/GlpR family DNA-binding transcription regulator [Deminuibacter soli]RFM25973.1 DeoR/GlpR transcriptional regulator [Deminuibacter soli]
MLKEERLDFILQRLKDNQKVTLGELSGALQVSEDTVRRDIELLANNGLLMKVRGGAIPHSPNVHSFKERIHLLEHNKKQVAEKALGLLQPGQVILLDGGTTTYTIASMLPHDLAITVVTNNIPIAALLADHPSVELILAGGKVFKNSQVTMGMEALRMFRRMRVDTCFIGVCSLHHEIGISTNDYGEAEVKSEMLKCANRVVAVTTNDKIGTAEPYKVCDITELDTIVTEESTDSDLLKPYTALGIKVL